MNRKYRPTPGAGLCTLLLTICACTNAEPETPSPLAHWAGEEALVLADLKTPLQEEQVAWLRDAVGNAELIGIGESRHDTHEQQRLKSLLIRHMVEDLGVRAMILEESGAHMEPLDCYLTSGEGELDSIMNDLAGWYLWDTEGMAELFSWMRTYNELRAPDQQVRVFGMDITAPDQAVRSVLKVLGEQGVGAEFSEAALGLDLQEGAFWPEIWDRYAATSSERRAGLARNYDKLLSVVEEQRESISASSSPVDFERLTFLAECGRRGNDFFSSASREEAGIKRETSMVGAVEWIREHEIPGQRAILWAHNLHVAKSTFRLPGILEGPQEPMGVALAASLGDAYLAIGASFGAGAYPSDLPPGERTFERSSNDTMDGSLAALGASPLLLDLRTAASGTPARAWLQVERDWLAQEATSRLVPWDAFDLVYFVDEITRDRPTPAALHKFQAMR